MIKDILKVNLFSTLILTIVTWLVGAPQQAMSCVLAGLLVGANLAIVVWSAKNIFQKKSVALTGSVIVIKYAALIAFFVAIIRMGWQLDFGFAIGLSAMFPPLGYLAYKHLKAKEISRTDGTF